MRRALRYPQLTFLTVVLALLSFSFAWPLFSSITHNWFGLLGSTCPDDGWCIPFARSALFAIASTLFAVIPGFLIALAAKDCNRSVGTLLAVLMLPMLTGAVAIGFCIKLDILRSTFVTSLIANRSFVPTWGLMLLVQMWQLLTLSIYLFWFRLQQVPGALVRFSVANNLSQYEKIRDIYWPFTKNLAGMLSLFTTSISFYEFIKFNLVIRASRGGGTELASHWLLRFYNFYSTVDPRIAIAKCLGVAVLAVILATIIIFLTIVLTLSTIGFYTRCAAQWGGAETSDVRRTRSNVVAILLIVITLAPLCGLVSYLNFSYFVPIDEFFRSVVLAAGAALLTTAVAIFLGVSGRLLLKQLMERFTSRSAIAFAVLYFIQVIPAIGIALCGYYWLGVLASHGRVGDLVPVLWLVCQLIIALPVITSFVLVSHFRVGTYEIDFQESFKVGFLDLVLNSFIRRFTFDYLLAGVFAFSMIWTESTINSTISDLSRNIPSISVELAQRVDGRGASYPEAANLIVATLFPVLLTLALWLYNARRSDMLTQPH
jgi:ABC-type sugar transport system permease subunit